MLPGFSRTAHARCIGACGGFRDAPRDASKPLTASAVAETIEPAVGYLRPSSAGRGHWLARLVTSRDQWRQDMFSIKSVTCYIVAGLLMGTAPASAQIQQASPLAQSLARPLAQSLARPLPAVGALVVAPAMAQTKPPTNSVTLAWTNPTTYTTGQALTIGQVTVFFDNSATSVSGAPTTFTTPVLVGGTHSFTVVVCDNISPANCSPVSAAATVTIPATPLAIPAASNLTAVVDPGVFTPNAAPPSRQSASAPSRGSASPQSSAPDRSSVPSAGRRSR
jgi:hypothetical protein